MISNTSGKHLGTETDTKSHFASNLLSLSVFVFYITIATLTYTTITLFTRLVLSPIAKFPGPKLAAATGWYEFYYNYFGQGSYIYQIEQMHKQYGPIVRVNPDELSIHDPEFYDEIYCPGSRRRTDKFSHFAKGAGLEDSHFLTESYDLHRKRRKPLEPYFSPSGISKLRPILMQSVQKLEKRLAAFTNTDKVVRLDHVFSAFTGDIIGQICCEDREDFLDDPDFAPYWYDTFHAILKSVPLMTGFPWLVHLINWIPSFLIDWLNSDSRKLGNFKKLATQHINTAKEEKAQGRSVQPGDQSRPTIFRYLVNSDMPESEMSTDRLAEEAHVLLGGGTVAAAKTLCLICYYVLAYPKIHRRLSQELRQPLKDYPDESPSLHTLESLPYLSAVIKEGLRLSYGNMHRLSRVSTNSPIRYKNWIIPAGVPVGMSAYLMHIDPEVYPDPHEFKPERWIDPKLPVNRNYAPFSRGSRSCLGINQSPFIEMTELRPVILESSLAHAELYTLLAVLFRPTAPLRFKLFDTDKSDVTPVHDLLVPLPRLDSKGVRVRVHSIGGDD